MDARIIPALILIINSGFSIFGIFIHDFPSAFSFWSIISTLSIAIVALMVYMNAKKIEFVEKRIWNRFTELEENIRINIELLEDLKKAKTD
jgi:hypothetical protein